MYLIYLIYETTIYVPAPDAFSGVENYGGTTIAMAERAHGNPYLYHLNPHQHEHYFK